MLFSTKENIQTNNSLASLKLMADGETVCVHGSVHIIRGMGDVSFVLLRLSQGIIQCVYDKATCDFSIDDLAEESCIEVTGTIKKEERSPAGFEIILTGLKVLSKPFERLPVSINKRKMNIALETELPLRPVILRNGERRARFKIQEGIVRGFRDFLFDQNFTEVRSPKIGAASAEGGSNVFKLDYFGKKAFLAQSPQFYKQTLVGVYERVFEVAPVFRAEKHGTARHLNEYISMDFEMGYIKSFEDIMDMETGMLSYVFNLLATKYENEVKGLNLELPVIDKIPTVKFKDAKELIANEYNRKIKDPFDLEPEEEVLIGKYFKEKYNSDFVFVTHYPVKKRPFYAMDDPSDPKYTLSFDLLFRGMEITTGGQRIHDYEEQCNKMVSKGLDPADFESYLMIHKHGIPPHGGLGIGLERLCMKLFDDNNIRLSSMFPRDINRLTP